MDAVGRACIMHRRDKKCIQNFSRFIKINIIGVGWETVDWIRLAQERAQWRSVVLNFVKIGDIFSS
jgi:hypothetical protein